MAHIREIVFDCSQAAALARFWAAMISGYKVRDYDEEDLSRLRALGLTPETDPTVMVDGPGPSLCFQQMPSRRRDNNRLHLDIAVNNREKAVARARRLGGTYVRERNRYTVMLDPEGNQFCLVDS